MSEAETMFSIVCRNTVIPLLLRLALAAVFVYHGLDMVSGEDHRLGSNWDRSADSMPGAVQVAVAWGELLGGVALAFGFLTRVAALGIFAIMAGAIAKVHWQHGFNGVKGGYEYNFVIMVICICLMLGGAGTLAVDRVFHFRRKPPER
jgi:putative oxidoreductase